MEAKREKKKYFFLSKDSETHGSATTTSHWLPQSSEMQDGCLIFSPQICNARITGELGKVRKHHFLVFRVKVHKSNLRECAGREGVRITCSSLRSGWFKPAAWNLLSEIAHAFLNPLQSSPFCYWTKSLAICRCPKFKLFPAHLSQMLHNR